MLKTRRDNRRLIMFGVLLIAAIGLIALGRTGATRPLVSLVATPLQPFARLLTTGTLSALDSTGEAPDVEAMADRLLEYERTIAELQVEVVRLREIEKDYQRVTGLIDYQALHRSEEHTSELQSREKLVC